MKNKELHPLLQVFLTLLFVALLMMFFVSFGIEYLPSNDFDKIRKKYGIELHLAMVISSLSAMFFIYFNLRFRVNKSRARLYETEPIFHWNYETRYWQSFKTKEFQKKGLLYFLKILLIWVPIGSFLFFLYKEVEPMVSIVLLLLILILTIPMIPFTLGKFIHQLKNQLFQNKYEVKIYKNGLTINEAYYPYNHYLNSNNNLRLVDIEKLNLYNTSCLKFVVKKAFYSPASPDGGGFGSVIKRTAHIFIPIPKNQDIDLSKIKNHVNLKNQTQRCL
ncbi:hypothetical protein AAG747_21065 [Rapidithrix thailandica]|uniref:Uncharacterized protein n=1 Tax=Rapidithrix thailandica TaxID=413964 RepID=A0AAW9SD92_9BACT